MANKDTSRTEKAKLMLRKIKTMAKRIRKKINLNIRKF